MDSEKKAKQLIADCNHCMQIKHLTFLFYIFFREGGGLGGVGGVLGLANDNLGIIAVHKTHLSLFVFLVSQLSFFCYNYCFMI